LTVARILFAWELGGEYGHALACAILARGLHARGHHIALMFREKRPLAVLPETSAYDIFQAPRQPVETAGTRPASIADILLNYGYAKESSLGALLDVWLARFKEWKPDLIVSDYAPTALLAARMLGIARVSYGNGFYSPPRLDPLPAFRVDVPVAPQTLRESNDRALATVNAVLVARGAEPLARLADLFEVDEDFLCTFPEIDHYGTRPKAGYWGPRFRFDRGREMRWPKGTGKRVLAYVKTNNPHLDAILEYLARGPTRSLVHVPGLDAERRARYSTPRCSIADRPIRLDAVMKECDLVISHGGAGTSGGALVYGVPQFVTPSHYEQFLTAVRLAQLGVGVWIAPEASAEECSRALAQALSNPLLALNAQIFARRYPEFTFSEQQRRIIGRVEEILATRSILPRSQVSGAPQ